jgi:hypothetical protein
MGIKYQVNENYFKKWTKNMAYVLGYIYADGSLEDASYIRGKYVRITSTEKMTIVKIKKILGSKHKIIEKIPAIKKRKKVYLLRIGSHNLYKDLTDKGLFPNKSLTIRFPDVPKKYLKFFILGYFDGDGCIRIAMEKGKSGNKIIKKLSLVFTCGSKVFLKKLAEKIYEEVNIGIKKVYNGHRSYMLCFSTSDSVELFKFLYKGVNKKLFLKRKFKVFKKYFGLRKCRIDRSVNIILRYNS